MWVFVSIVIVFCVLRFGKVGRFSKIDPQAKRKLVIVLIPIMAVLVIGPSNIFYSALDIINETAKAVAPIIHPPPPEVKWEGSTIIEAPVESNWNKVPEVTALKWQIVQWQLTAMAPHNQGHYEMMAEGWEKPWQSSYKGVFEKCPDLPDSLRFKIRSLEKWPMKFKLQWR